MITPRRPFVDVSRLAALPRRWLAAIVFTVVLAAAASIPHAPGLSPVRGLTERLGSQTVESRSPSASGTSLVGDSFGRIVENGWGSSERGLSWRLLSTDGGDLSGVGSVDGHRGILNLGGQNRARIASAVVEADSSFADGEVVVTAASDVPNASFGVIARAGSGGTYSVSLTIGRSVLTLASSKADKPLATSELNETFRPNVLYTIRFQLQGEVMRAKAWATGTVEPGWQVSAVEYTFTEGSVGVFGLVSATPSQGRIGFENFDENALPAGETLPRPASIYAFQAPTLLLVILEAAVLFFLVAQGIRLVWTDRRRPRSFLTTALAIIGIGCAAGAWCYVRRSDPALNPGAGDFFWAIFIAEHLANGTDPYAIVPNPDYIPYPLPVALFGIPFILNGVPGLSWLPAVPGALAAAIHFGVSSAILAAGILIRGEPLQLLMFLSWPFVQAVTWAQWSPLVASSWFFPRLAGPLALVKPQLAVPIALTRWSWISVFSAGAILLGSLLLYPTWPLRWIALIAQFEGFVPIFSPFGFVLGLALVQWRNPKARFLLLSALFPIRTTYDCLPLFLVPSTRVQAVLMWSLTLAISRALDSRFLANRVTEHDGLVLAYFIPALLAVLLNEPAVERVQRAWARWIATGPIPSMIAARLSSRLR